MTTPGKNGNEDEKLWKNDFDVWILDIKIRLCRKSWENFFDPSFKGFFTLLKYIFLTNWGKNEDKDEKFGKISPIFEFSISKLGYMELFIKIWEKSFILEIFISVGNTRTEVLKRLIDFATCWTWVVCFYYMTLCSLLLLRIILTTWLFFITFFFINKLTIFLKNNF